MLRSVIWLSVLFFGVIVVSVTVVLFIVVLFGFLVRTWEGGREDPWLEDEED